MYDIKLNLSEDIINYFSNTKTFRGKGGIVSKTGRQLSSKQYNYFVLNDGKLFIYINTDCSEFELINESELKKASITSAKDLDDIMDFLWKSKPEKEYSVRQYYNDKECNVEQILKSGISYSVQDSLIEKTIESCTSWRSVPITVERYMETLSFDHLKGHVYSNYTVKSVMNEQNIHFSIKPEYIDILTKAVSWNKKLDFVIPESISCKPITDPVHPPESMMVKIQMSKISDMHFPQIQTYMLLDKTDITSINGEEFYKLTANATKRINEAYQRLDTIGISNNSEIHSVFKDLIYKTKGGIQEADAWLDGPLADNIYSFMMAFPRICRELFQKESSFSFSENKITCRPQQD